MLLWILSQKYSLKQLSKIYALHSILIYIITFRQLAKVKDKLKMTQIIGVHIGQFGLNIAQQFWNQIIEQHQILSNETRGRMIFFQQKLKEPYFYQNRAVFWDTQNKNHQKLYKSNSLFNPDNSIISITISNQSSRNLFPQGMYLIKEEKQQQFKDRLRKNTQSCEKLSGFLLSSSLNGGAGSGLGGLSLRIMREYYPSYIVQCNALFPHINVKTNPLQIYNTVFSIHHYVQEADLVTLFDNKSCENILTKSGEFIQDFTHINKLIGNAMTQVTSSMRFGGNLNTSQRKIATNLILFPRIKFLYQTLGTQNTGLHINHYLINALNIENFLCGDNSSTQNRLFTLYANIRNPLEYEEEIINTIKNRFTSQNVQTIDWIPDSSHISICNTLNKSQKPSATILCNGYMIRQRYLRLSQLFTSLFRRKAFIHHYTSCGMDQMQFTQAQSNLNDLTSQYTYSQAYYDDYDQFQEGEF